MADKQKDRWVDGIFILNKGLYQIKTYKFKFDFRKTRTIPSYMYH